MPLPPTPCKSQSPRPVGKGDVVESANIQERLSSSSAHQQELASTGPQLGPRRRSWCRECRCRMRRGRQQPTVSFSSSSSSSSGSCESSDETSSTSRTLTSCRASCTQSLCSSSSSSSQSLTSSTYSHSPSCPSSPSTTCSGRASCGHLSQSAASCYQCTRGARRRRRCCAPDGGVGQLAPPSNHSSGQKSKRGPCGLSSVSLNELKAKDKERAELSSAPATTRPLSLSSGALDRLSGGASSCAQRNESTRQQKHRGGNRDKSYESLRAMRDNSSSRTQLAGSARRVVRDETVLATSAPIGSPPSDRQDSERTGTSTLKSAACEQTDSNYDRLRRADADPTGALGVAVHRHDAPATERKQLAAARQSSSHHYRDAAGCHHSFRSMCELNGSGNDDDDYDCDEEEEHRQPRSTAVGSQQPAQLHAKNRNCRRDQDVDLRRSNELARGSNATAVAGAHHRHHKPQQEARAHSERRRRCRRRHHHSRATATGSTLPVYKNQLQSFYWYEFESHLTSRRQQDSDSLNVGANDNTGKERELELVQLAESLAEFAQRTGCLHCHCRHQLLMLVRNEQILNLMALRIQQGIQRSHDEPTDDDDDDDQNHQDNEPVSLEQSSIGTCRRRRYRRLGSRGAAAEVQETATEVRGFRRKGCTRSDDDEPSQLSSTSLNSRELSSGCSATLNSAHSSASSIGSLWPGASNVRDNDDDDDDDADSDEEWEAGEDDGAQIEMPAGGYSIEPGESDTSQVAAAAVVTSNNRRSQSSARAGRQQDCSCSSSSASSSPSASSQSSLYNQASGGRTTAMRTNMSGGGNLNSAHKQEQERDQRQRQRRSGTSKCSAATEKLSNDATSDSARRARGIACNERATVRTTPAAAATAATANSHNGPPQRQRRLAVSGASADRSEQLGPTSEHELASVESSEWQPVAANHTPNRITFGLLLSRRLVGSQQTLAWPSTAQADNGRISSQWPVNATVRKQALKFHQSQMDNPNLIRRRHQYAQTGPSRTVDVGHLVEQQRGQRATTGLGASSLDLAGAAGSPSFVLRSRRAPLVRAGSQQELARVLDHLLEAQQRRMDEEDEEREARMRVADEESFEGDEQDRRRARRRAMDAGNPPNQQDPNKQVVGYENAQRGNNFMSHSELDLYLRSLAEKCPDTNSQLVR